MKNFIAPLILLTSLSAFAQDRRSERPLGRGGDVIVCRDAEGKIKSAELLVHYEGRINRGLVNVEHPHLTHEEYFEEMQSRIFAAKGDFEDVPKLIRALNDYRQSGKVTKGFKFTSDKLTDYPDYASVVPPKGCAAEQAILKVTPKFPTDSTYMVQADILKDLSEEGIRGLILNYALSEKPFTFDNSSVGIASIAWTRYFQQKITSVEITEVNFRTTVLLLKQIFGEYGGFNNPRAGMDLAIGNLNIHPQANLMANRSFVFNDDGTINREQTLKYGKIDFHVILNTFGRNNRHCPEDQFSSRSCEVKFPKGQVIQYHFEDGTSRHVNYNYYGNTTFGGGEVTLKYTIPKARRTDLAVDAFLYAQIKVNKILILDRVLDDGKTYSAKFRVDLDENNRWIISK